MSEKNADLLREVSQYFTEDKLKDIVAKEKSTEPSNVEILSWTFEELSGKGDNYLSVVNRVLVRSKVNNATVETKLIVKSLPKNLFRRKLLRSSEYFNNEINFYDKVATKFHSYLTAKKQNQLLSLPKCFAFHYDEENDYIALEDVTGLGYKSIPRQSCLCYDECKRFLEAIARFHGISFAYKNEQPEEFSRMSAVLTETFYHVDFYEASLKYFYNDFFRVAKDALAKEYPGSKAEKLFNEQQVDDLFARTAELCGRGDAKTSVVVQGDAWAPNFMVRRNASGVDIDILMLDFQMARCASPALDVSFFIYQCTDRLVREEHYDDLLADYHKELARTLRILGAEPDSVYPWKVFQDEIKQQSLYGLMFALVNIPLVLLPENKVIDLDAISEEINDIGDMESMPNLERAEDRKRLADVILHAVDKGFI